MTKMNRATQQWLRDALREHFPELVGKATFYYQAGGIKFWAIKAGGLTAQTIQRRVQAFLDKSDGGYAPQAFKAYAGVSHESAPAALYIVHRENPAPGVQPWRKYTPSMFNHSGFGERQKAAKKVMQGPPAVVIPYTTLRKWKQTLDHMSVEITRDSIGELRTVTAEMQKILVR